MSLMYNRLPDMLLTNHTGNLFGNEYREKLDGFKDEFGRARESFDRSIGLEMFKAIHGIGGIHVKLPDFRLI